MLVVDLRPTYDWFTTSYKEWRRFINIREKNPPHK